MKLLEIERTLDRERARGMKLAPFSAYRTTNDPPRLVKLTDRSARDWRTAERCAIVFDWILRLVTFGRLRVDRLSGTATFPEEWGDVGLYIRRAK